MSRLDFPDRDISMEDSEGSRSAQESTNSMRCVISSYCSALGIDITRLLTGSGHPQSSNGTAQGAEDPPVADDQSATDDVNSDSGDDDDDDDNAEEGDETESSSSALGPDSNTRGHLPPGISKRVSALERFAYHLQGHVYDLRLALGATGSERALPVVHPHRKQRTRPKGAAIQHRVHDINQMQVRLPA